MTTTEPAALLGGISSGFRVNPYSGTHVRVRRARGARFETADGGSFIDMFMAHGSTLLGHHHPAVVDAIAGILDVGVLSGYETGLGDEVAATLAEVIPSAQTARFVASGSEAVTTAIRLARAHTGRQLVVKIDGHFNGGSDYALLNSLVKGFDADNPGGTVSRVIRGSGGIPDTVAASVLPIPWNDLAALSYVLERWPDQIAAVLMVPIDYNNGCLTPAEGYLEEARRLTEAAGAVLVFDEVLSGFKPGLGGAQERYGVTPDLTTLSKALSSGAPLSAVVGSHEVMSTLAAPPPRGAVQGGTYAGNLLGLAAARATLEVISADGFYPDLLAASDRFYAELDSRLRAAGLPAVVQSEGCMFGIYVGAEGPVRGYADIRALDAELARSFFVSCLEEGVYFHTDFSISSAHTDEVLDEALERIAAAARKTVAARRPRTGR